MTGYIESFELKNSEEGLSTISLIKVYRRELKNDSPQNIDEQNIDDRYYSIPGQRFILKYSDIRNLSIAYLYISETTDASEKEIVDIPEIPSDANPSDPLKE